MNKNYNNVFLLTEVFFLSLNSLSLIGVVAQFG